ncbi:rhodanese-like domain-containing protein [Nodosilinea sp. E11]|uniref:rhodanese-like domain-containing protein n=1 Tax=Nodosilinea sp. E11 TaxID=3037479 RepID=UPI0029343CE0|nr:rhodanese-like domain-containing protein [Nodosilinea sp. E11]WOD38185.1 rhodanese-like domain-containing protein [Nodosilinea sp. E11]
MTNLPDPIENIPNQVERMAHQAEHIPEQAEEASDRVAEGIESVKDKVTQPLPTPPDMSKSQASPDELLKRLNWGEPALTILDVRSREAFNDERITGAVPMPIEQIPGGIESTLEPKRDIYIYGDSNDQAAQAASQLRQAGYTSVAVVQGGLPAWKGISGPTEGIKAFSSPVSA